MSKFWAFFCSNPTYIFITEKKWAQILQLNGPKIYKLTGVTDLNCDKTPGFSTWKNVHFLVEKLSPWDICGLH